MELYYPSANFFVIAVSQKTTNVIMYTHTHDSLMVYAYGLLTGTESLVGAKLNNHRLGATPGTSKIVSIIDGTFLGVTKVAGVL